MADAAKIGIVGSRSAIGQILHDELLEGAVGYRRGGHTRAGRELKSYQQLGPDDLAGLDLVINCAGATSGPDDTLERANVDLPRTLGLACREAGVKRIIHISSFSVYGPARRICETTPEQPVSAYGRSKLRGDEALAKLAGSDFAPLILRLPAILNAQKPSGKVSLLFSAWRRFGWFPVPRGDVRRAMISSRLAARAIARLAGDERAGIVHAADPADFTFALAARAMALSGAGRARRAPLPAAMFTPVEKLAPRIHASLFSNSELDKRANYCADMESDLLGELAALASRRTA